MASALARLSHLANDYRLVADNLILTTVLLQ